MIYSFFINCCVPLYKARDNTWHIPLHCPCHTSFSLRKPSLFIIIAERIKLLSSTQCHDHHPKYSADDKTYNQSQYKCHFNITAVLVIRFAIRYFITSYAKLPHTIHIIFTDIYRRILANIHRLLAQRTDFKFAICLHFCFSLVMKEYHNITSAPSITFVLTFFCNKSQLGFLSLRLWASLPNR